MISRFFSKTKPATYLVLSLLLLFFYIANLLLSPIWEITYGRILLEILTFAVLLGGLFLISQIVKAAKLTDSNAYAMLFFVLLLVAFPSIFSDKTLIFTNFFLLLAFHRLLAVASLKHIKHKLFDASFFIGIASLYCDWVLLFLVIVFCAIALYDAKNIKSWLVPFIGIATVFVLAFTVLQLYHALDFFGQHYQFSARPLPKFFREQILLKTMGYLLLMLSIIAIVFIRVRNIGGGKLLRLRLMFLIFVLGTVVRLIAPVSTAFLLVTFFPAVVFMAHALEAVKKKKVRETILGICLLLPFLLFALQYR